ncbi:uncharacterized protein [Palaemon carinicauda]|uniref:uncharacterized protein n=1 Tax=Palaemon carinicauda TaxID=392227 RepID=UPI0035B5A9F5
METKLEIVKKYESGMRLSAIAKEYSWNPFTIGTILKQKAAIKAATPSKGVTIFPTKEPTCMTRWRGCFLCGSQTKRSQETSSLRLQFARRPPPFSKMPCRTFITAKEKRLPGHKPMRDRLTLAFCANASGDCKIKPLLVYHSENPRAFKTHKVIKKNLPKIWRANSKAWPMDQQVISNFQKLYAKHLFQRCFQVTESTNITLREFWKDHFDIVICLKLIDLACQEVSRRTLNSSWRKLCPDLSNNTARPSSLERVLTLCVVRFCFKRWPFLVQRFLAHLAMGQLFHCCWDWGPRRGFVIYMSEFWSVIITMIATEVMNGYSLLVSRQIFMGEVIT